MGIRCLLYLLWLLSGCSGAPQTEPTLPGPPANAVPAQVERVIDGDTIEVRLAGQIYRLRYIGMDTPERGEPGFAEATALNRSLVAGQTVYLVRDVSETDRYGRLLRYVYLADGTFVNLELVRRGYAVAVTFPPDVAQSQRMRQAEQAARSAQVGLWAASPVQAGDAAGLCPDGCETPPPGCVIKGNISQNSGERIYHLPGQMHYEETRINPAQGERWFCTEAEAQSAGWRRAQR